MKTAQLSSLLILLTFGVFNVQVKAQQEDFKYRRSSLSMILIESESFPNKDAVMASWNSYPFPDKYNKHNIDLKSINIESMPVDDSKLTEKQVYQARIDKAIKDQGLAKQLISTWFNRSADSKFDMSLIQERGFYNATELEASIAKGQARGMAALGDAGEELIKNTFVTFTKLQFIENEPVARAARDASKAEIAEKMAGKPQMLIDKAMKAADATYEETKEGYSLWSKTWLYQLNWNDSTAAVFYNDLWADPTSFENSDLFKLNFIGVQYNQSIVTFKIGEERTQEQIIDLALVRNIDNAFAKLQKQNEVFKPKVPVLSTNPITAKIGMKEGLEGGEKFEVLEMVFDPKTGLTQYKEIGTVIADKTIVWDNRYNAGESVEPAKDASGYEITATIFKGSKNIQPGMLLKLAK